MRGVLSLGGNLSKYSDEDIKTCRKYVDMYKGFRDIIQFGDLYRLLDIDKDEISADIYVDSKKEKAVLFIASVNTRMMKKTVPLYIDGLDEKKVYKFEFEGKEYKKSGAYLKNVGIPVEIRKQYYNSIISVKAV